MKNLDENLKKIMHQRLDSKSTNTSFEQVWEGYKSKSNLKLNKKKWFLGLGIPMLVIVGSGAAVMASSLLSNYTNNIKTASKATGVFEYINGKPISNKKFEYYKAWEQFLDKTRNQKYSQEQAIQLLNTQEVLYQAAQKQNIVVSNQKAKQYAAKARQMVEHPPASASPTNVKQIRQLLKAKEKGLGVSDNQYWSQIAPKNYKISLSIANLKKQFVNHYRTKHRGAQYNSIEAAWKQYSQQLVHHASIRRVTN